MGQIDTVTSDREEQGSSGYSQPAHTVPLPDHPLSSMTRMVTEVSEPSLTSRPGPPAPEMPTQELLDRIHADPGLPVPYPTTPLWQVPPHPLAQISSPTLAKSTDVVIIGSGISALSVAKGLLDGSPDLKITVLEARALCSGASSRNGGHITSPSFQDFALLVKAWGPQMAAQIAEFTLTNVDKTFELVESFGGPDLKAVSEIRRTEKVHAFRDQATLDKFRDIVRLWDEHMPPHRTGKYKILTADEAKEKYGLKNVTGAVATSGAAVWPYRLWTGLWAQLLAHYAGRLSIETHTPALRVRAAPYAAHFARPRYLVATPRGDIEAGQVVYATNGFTGHLLPALRGHLFPLRGTMSAQDAGPGFPNAGAARSWQFYRERLVAPHSAALPGALYYLTQHPASGLLFLGGETDALATVLDADDSVLNGRAATHITRQLPDLFDAAPPEPGLRSVWSGVMGFTVDGLPLIGKVPESISGRRDAGEWIAAGFNGYGTGYCYLCGQAVAQMMLGKDVSTWVPSPFFLTRERLEGSLATKGWWNGLMQW